MATFPHWLFVAFQQRLVFQSRCGEQPWSLCRPQSTAAKGLSRCWQGDTAGSINDVTFDTYFQISFHCHLKFLKVHHRRIKVLKSISSCSQQCGLCEPVEGKLLVCSGDVLTGAICGSHCCNKAAVHNYNRLIEEFLSLKAAEVWEVSDSGARWHRESQHPTYSFHSLALFFLFLHGVYLSTGAALCKSMYFLCLALAFSLNGSLLWSLFRHSVTPFLRITSVHLCQKGLISFSRHQTIAVFVPHSLIPGAFALVSKPGSKWEKQHWETRREKATELGSGAKVGAVSTPSQTH